MLLNLFLVLYSTHLEYEEVSGMYSLFFTLLTILLDRSSSFLHLNIMAYLLFVSLAHIYIYP